MRLKTLLIATLVAASMPALAQTAEAVNTVLDAVFGEHARFAAAFTQLQEAVAEEDAEEVAALAAYPLVVKVGERVQVGSAEAFVAAYSDIMTDEIVTAVMEQGYESLFASEQGIMIGNGQVWMSGVCADDACENWDVRIVTIQSTLR